MIVYARVGAFYQRFLQILYTDALGYVAAEDVCANESLPPYRASIMDGYAVVGEVLVCVFNKLINK